MKTINDTQSPRPRREAQKKSKSFVDLKKRKLSAKRNRTAETVAQGPAILKDTLLTSIPDQDLKRAFSVAGFVCIVLFLFYYT